MRSFSLKEMPYPATGRRMERCLDQLVNFMMVRYAIDDRGRYIAGFQGLAIEARANSRHEKRTYAWYQSEAARLILATIEADRRGGRKLTRLSDHPASDVEAAIIDRVKAVIPAWTRTLALKNTG